MEGDASRSFPDLAICTSRNLDDWLSSQLKKDSNPKAKLPVKIFACRSHALADSVWSSPILRLRLRLLKAQPYESPLKNPPHDQCISRKHSSIHRKIVRPTPAFPLPKTRRITCSPQAQVFSRQKRFSFLLQIDEAAAGRARLQPRSTFPHENRTIEILIRVLH